MDPELSPCDCARAQRHRQSQRATASDTGNGKTFSPPMQQPMLPLMVYSLACM